MTTGGIRDVLRTLGIVYRDHGESPHVSEGWLGIVCPFPGCGAGGKFGCGINIRTRVVTCWKCGRHRLGDTLAAASGKTIREIMPHIAEIAPDATRNDERPTGRYKPPPGVGPLLTAHKRYLRGRGFDPDELTRVWGIGGINGAESRLGWRLFIPVNVGGKPVSWTTRAIGAGDGVGMRYLAAPPTDESTPIKHTLFGIDHVRHACIVVEGPFDAMRIGPGAVATYGLTVTAAQIRRLSQIPRRVICFDNEPAAQRRAVELSDQLAVFPGETFVCRLSDDSPDPGSATAADIEYLRSEFLE